MPLEVAPWSPSGFQTKVNIPPLKFEILREFRVTFTFSAYCAHEDFLDWEHPKHQEKVVQKSLLFKVITIVILAAAICIPLAMIQATIAERSRFRDDAIRGIARESVAEQSLVGPLMIVPYIENYDENIERTDNAPAHVRHHRIERILTVFPDELKVSGDIRTEGRTRGIHKILVFSGQHRLTGSFSAPVLSDFAVSNPNSTIELQHPYLSMMINDIRGIRSLTGMTWDESALNFREGSHLDVFKNGLNASLPDIDLSKPQQTHQFLLNITLDGIENMSFTPIAKSNTFELKSNWPHPQFGGSFLPLPNPRRIDDQGFEAKWTISALATDTQERLSTAIGQAQDTRIKQTDARAIPAPGSFKVSFIEPINIYVQADRAVKYGAMFVFLTFAVFFVYEILKTLPIHPVQYGLVGLALTVFFLLLLSLSEHIDFAQAYLASSIASISLIAYYLVYVLRSWVRASGFTLGLCALYAALFKILQSENSALLMGSILLFAILAAVMIATRKLDWYKVGTIAATQG